MDDLIKMLLSQPLDQNKLLLAFVFALYKEWIVFGATYARVVKQLEAYEAQARENEQSLTTVLDLLEQRPPPRPRRGNQTRRPRRRTHAVHDHGGTRGGGHDAA